MRLWDNGLSPRVLDVQANLLVAVRTPIANLRFVHITQATSASSSATWTSSSATTSRQQGSGGGLDSDWRYGPDRLRQQRWTHRKQPGHSLTYSKCWMSLVPGVHHQW